MVAHARKASSNCMMCVTYHMVNGPEAGARNEIRVERHHDYSSIPRLVCKQNIIIILRYILGFFLRLFCLMDLIESAWFWDLMIFISMN